MKIGTIINYVDIKLRVDGKFTLTKNEYKIIGINEDYIVINDRHFKTLQLKKGPYDIHLLLDKPKAHECEYNVSCLVDYVDSYIYTTSSMKVAFNKCKKELEKFLNIKYSKYSGLRINLNTIKFEGGTTDTGNV